MSEPTQAASDAPTWAEIEQCAPWCLNGAGGPLLGCNCGAEERDRQTRRARYVAAKEADRG